jgi:hypothetical protein
MILRRFTTNALPAGPFVPYSNMAMLRDWAAGRWKASRYLQLFVKGYVAWGIRKGPYKVVAEFRLEGCDE